LTGSSPPADREDEAHAKQETDGRRGRRPQGGNARRRPAEVVQGGVGGARDRGYGNGVERIEFYRDMGCKKRKEY
jgi:hypothetical protein